MLERPTEYMMKAAAEIGDENRRGFMHQLTKIAFSTAVAIAGGSTVAVARQSCGGEIGDCTQDPECGAFFCWWWWNNQHESCLVEKCTESCQPTACLYQNTREVRIFEPAEGPCYCISEPYYDEDHSCPEDCP